MEHIAELLIVGSTLFANTTHAEPIEIPGGDYNDQYVWHGLTKGPGIPPEGLPFELSVPK